MPGDGGAAVVGAVLEALARLIAAADLERPAAGVEADAGSTVLRSCKCGIVEAILDVREGARTHNATRARHARGAAAAPRSVARDREAAVALVAGVVVDDHARARLGTE